MNLSRALFNTPKFQKLLIHTRGRHKAIGIVCELWVLAKEYYLAHRRPIPKAELVEADIPIEKLVRLGFLVKEPEGFYMKGSEEEFEPYFDAMQQRRRAGVASAKSPNHHMKRDENGRFAPKVKPDDMSKVPPPFDPRKEVAKLKKTTKVNTSGTPRKKKKIVKNTKKSTKKKVKRDSSVAKRKKKKGRQADPVSDT